MEIKKEYIKYTPEELEGTRKNMWRSRYLPILYEFLELKDGMKILDIGCGTGFFTRMMASKIKGEIIGIDIDDEVLEVARKLTKKQSLDVKYLKQNIYDLKFEDNYFDLVTSHMTLCNLREIEKALKEMKRVTKIKGKIVAIEPCNSSGFQFYGSDPEIIELLKLISKAKKGYDEKMKKDGSDLDLGPKLPFYFYKIGLKNVDVEEYSIINFSNQKSQKRFEFELRRLKDAVPEYLTKEEFNRIKYLSKRKRKQIQGSISTLPLFMVKGIKYE
ncbi:MAG: class I SAM-dependent methyltransferase [Candidatus Aenigmatarchaeota archaeon]